MKTLIIISRLLFLIAINLWIYHFMPWVVWVEFGTIAVFMVAIVIVSIWRRLRGSK